MNVGKQERSGVAQSQGSGGYAGAKVIQLQSGVGHHQTMDAKRKTLARALGVFETAKPTLGPIETDLGQLSAKERGVKADGDGLDAQSGAVLDSANFQLSDPAPTGGGKRGWEIGDKEKEVKRDGR